MKLSHTDKASDSSRPPRPSLGQLKAWASQEETKWVLKQLNHRFPSYKGDLPIRSQEAALLLNYKAGCRTVLDDLERLIENGEL